MRDGHWQYLAHVEPVLPTPRASDLSHQWRPTLPDLPPRRPSALALTVAVCALVYAPAAPVAALDWLPPPETPIRLTARAASFATGAERVLEPPVSQHTTWYTPLSEPRRAAVPPIATATGAEWVRAPAPPAPVIVVPLPLAEPGFRPSRVAVEAATGVLAYAPPPTVVSAEPIEPLSEPVRAPARVASYATNAERVLEPPSSQHVTWYAPLAEPRRAPARPPTVATGAELVAGVAAPGPVVVLPPLAEPARIRARVASDASGGEVALGPVVAAPPLDWCQPLSEPIRIARATDLATGADRTIGVYPTVPVVAWPFRPLTEPVRFRARCVSLATGAEFVCPAPVSARVVRFTLQLARAAAFTLDVRRTATFAPTVHRTADFTVE